MTNLDIVATKARAGSTTENEWAVFVPGRAMRIGMVQYRASDKRFKPRLFLTTAPQGALEGAKLVCPLPSCGTRQGAIDALVQAFRKTDGVGA
jgi:hypothetical protein